MAKPNTNNYSISTTPYLVGDLQKTITGTGLSVPNSNPIPTAVGGVPVAAAFEIQSTTGLALAPRLSDANVTAITDPTANPTGIINGMFYYNTTDNVFYFIQNGVPTPIPTGAGSGNVVGPNTPVIGTLAYFPSNLSPNIQDTNSGTFGINILANELIISGSPGTANQLATFTGTHLTGGAGGVIQGVPVTIDNAGNIAGIASIDVGTGTAGAPTYSFTGHTTTGLFYDTATNQLAFSGAGYTQAEIGAVANTVNFVLLSGGATGNAVALGVTGSASDANVSINVVPKGTGALLNVAGLLATPSYSFAGRANTGMWSSGANTINFSAAGVEQLRITGAASAVNFLTIMGEATGIPIVLSAANSADANVSIEALCKGTGVFGIASTLNTQPGILQLEEASVNGNLFVNIAAPANVTASYTLTMPATYVGSVNGQALTIVSGGGTAAPVLGFANTSGLQSASGTILNAAAQAAYTTPISLVAAGGASTIVIIERVTVEFVGAVPFVGAGDFVIEYGSVAHGTGPSACGSILNASFVGLGASTILFSNPTVASIAVAGATNLGVFLSATGGGNFTGGGALNYTVQYYVITVT